MTSIPRRAVITVAALFVLCALLVRDAGRPPAPVPASAPATQFSAERALAHLREIAQRPHSTGSADNARVRDYLVAQLRSLGLDTQVQEATGVGTRYARAGRVGNVIGRLPGRTPGGLAVVLMSHYDGVEGGPAASDAGAGTAAILETLRALRTGPPLAHDVIALITDGEEAGLLGAAAFVREHPWAKDVGVTLNFEARGTTGRSLMFETGPGNLDVARILRVAGDVSATSLSVTVYRSLPNDTDLSEMAVLKKPALNFAFADGVERYHTAHDDVANLNPGSLQHHGSQMLPLVRAFGDGPLPRPVTGDAVFFDLPLVGLIVYPETWAWPLTLVAVALALATVVRAARTTSRPVRDVILGALATLLSIVIAAALAMVVGLGIVRAHTSMGWGGTPAFRGVYTAALALLTVAIALALWRLVRRWASDAGAHAGALVVWAALTVLVTWKLPGVSFMLVWPLLAGTLVSRVTANRQPSIPSGAATGPVAEAALWIATVVAAAIMVPIVYSVSAVMLGNVGPGGIAAGALVSLLAWLLAPHMEAVGAGRRWLPAGVALGVTVCAVLFGMATVRSSPRHPTPSQVIYAVHADSTDAWIATGRRTNLVTATSGPSARVPSWLQRSLGAGAVAFYPAPRVAVDAPTVTLVADSTTTEGRRLAFLVRAASGTQTITLRANETRVLASAVDGRAIDPTRYRGSVRLWNLTYTAPPDSGFTLALTVPAGSGVALDLVTRNGKVPALNGIAIANRPPDVVTAQTGDGTMIFRTVRFP